MSTADASPMRSPESDSGSTEKPHRAIKPPLGALATKWVEWFRDDDEAMISEIPPELLTDEVLDELTKIHRERLDKATVVGRSKVIYLFNLSRDKEITFERSMLNSDISDFINGVPIEFQKDILRLRDGSYTNILSKEWIRQGKYDENIRYVLRALLTRLAKIGSRTEKTNALYEVKNFQREYGLNAYPGMDESTASADSQNIILTAGFDPYASGGDKPLGYLGRGFVREYAEKYADKTSSDAKTILFGGKGYEKILNDLKRISLKTTLDKKGKLTFENSVSSYAELNGDGKARIDAIIEFTATLLSGKAVPSVQAFEGKDQWVLADAFRIFSLLDKGTDAENKALMEMLRQYGDIGKTVENLKEASKELFDKFTNSTISYQMEKGLKKAIADFAGIEFKSGKDPDEKPDKDEDDYAA